MNRDDDDDDGGEDRTVIRDRTITRTVPSPVPASREPRPQPTTQRPPVEVPKIPEIKVPKVEIPKVPELKIPEIPRLSG